MATPNEPRPDLMAASRGDLIESFTRLRTAPRGCPRGRRSGGWPTSGANELPSAGKPSVLEKVLIQVRNLFNILLLFASPLSFLVGFAYGDPGSLQRGLAILGVVLFNIAFRILQEHGAEKVVEALRRPIPTKTNVVRGGTVAQIPVAQLVPGDVFNPSEGDRVPADARLLSSFGLMADQSILAGEAALQERSADARPGPEVDPSSQGPDLLLAGTTVASGSATALAIATGPRAVFGRIVATTQEVKEAPSPLQRQLGRTARLNVSAAIAMGAAFLVISLVVRNLSFLNAVLIVIAVAIDLVPEGLQITVTPALAIASIAMSRRNVVVKRLAAVETLGCRQAAAGRPGGFLPPWGKREGLGTLARR